MISRSHDSVAVAAGVAKLLFDWIPELIRGIVHFT